MHLYHILINWSQKFWVVYVQYRFIYEQCVLQKFNDIGGMVLKPKKNQPPTSVKR